MVEDSGSSFQMRLHWFCVGWPGSKGPAEDFLTSVAIAVSESGLVVTIEAPKLH